MRSRLNKVGMWDYVVNSTVDENKIKEDSSRWVEKVKTWRDETSKIFAVAEEDEKQHQRITATVTWDRHVEEARMLLKHLKGMPKGLGLWLDHFYVHKGVSYLLELLCKVLYHQNFPFESSNAWTQQQSHTHTQHNTNREPLKQLKPQIRDVSKTRKLIQRTPLKSLTAILAIFRWFAGDEMGAKLISKSGDEVCRELISDFLELFGPQKKMKTMIKVTPSCSLNDLLTNLDTALAKSVLMSTIARKSSVSQITRAILVARRKASSSFSIKSALSSSSSCVTPIPSHPSYGSVVSVHDVRQLMRQVSSNGSMSKLAPPSRSFVHCPPLNSFSSSSPTTSPPIASNLSTNSSSLSLPPPSSSSELRELQELLSMKAMSETDVERSKKLMARLSVKKFHQ